MIRIDALWGCTELLDMGAGMGAALGGRVTVFGAVRPHPVCLIATQMKVLVQAAIGACAAERRLDGGKFVWPHEGTSLSVGWCPRIFDRLRLKNRLQGRWKDEERERAVVTQRFHCASPAGLPIRRSL